MVGHDLVETLEQCLKMAKEARDSNKPKIGDMVYAWDGNPEIDGFMYGEYLGDYFGGIYSQRVYVTGRQTMRFNHISKNSPI